MKMNHMNYVSTRYKNIHKLGNRYRVRKYVNGVHFSKMCDTLKECKLWLANFN